MRGDYSAIPDVSSDKTSAILYQQGRLLSDYDLNRQNLLLRKRINNLEELVVKLIQFNKLGLQEKDNGEVIPDVVNKAGKGTDAGKENSLILPRFATIPGAEVIHFGNAQFLDRANLESLLGSPFGDDAVFLYVMATEAILDSKRLAEDGLSNSMIMSQRNVLRVAADEIVRVDDGHAPVLTISGTLQGKGVHRFALHQIIRDAAPPGGPRKVWLKYSATNQAQVYYGTINGNTITVNSGGTRALRNSDCIEFLVPGADNLLKDSTQFVKSQGLYRITKRDGARYDVELLREQGADVASIPTTDPKTDAVGECSFVVWDWASAAELKKTVKVNETDWWNSEHAGEGINVTVKLHSSTNPLFGWTATVDSGAVPGKELNFRQTAGILKLAKFKYNGEALELVASLSTGRPVDHAVASIPVSKPPVLLESNSPPEVPQVAPLLEPVTPVEDVVFVAAASESEYSERQTDPEPAVITIRDIPVRLLNLHYQTPELRRWASSVDLSEVTSLSPESLMERVGRRVSADRRTVLSADVLAFVQQLAEISTQLRTTESPIQTA